MNTKSTTAREDWADLQDRIDQSFYGDHGRPKKHIYLSRDDWEKIKAASAHQHSDIDQAAINRLLTPID